ncbi:uncharacterized protein LOC107820836 [Nicotiana tabacum]|uniref:Uncharacterized protein LOC107820836 n=2 Tax=Nicotiana TaxID=4085 RepID=A0A1S4CNM8_TOBAC|nr:PREDICTED: uncharacterized protein LOC104210125 [Nicotiana sylvestris]XP_016502665.1 PREDICTED: uncharacterized protein LOC107820836 [Nicotiana tabacum]
MAYRRRQGMSKSSTFKEESFFRPPPDDDDSLSSSSSLAAQAIKASAAHRDSSLSSAYADSAFPHPHPSQAAASYEYTSLSSSNEAGGFWGVLARKAKAILDDDNISQQFEAPASSTLKETQYYRQYQNPNVSRKVDNPKLRKGLDALTSSLNHIGDTIGNALEEGRTIVENKTADIIQETRKLQIRRKGTNFEEQNHVSSLHSTWQQSSRQTTQPHTQTNHEDQLKASRDVAMATAAKAKLLLRELKTVKADLAFAKLRCSQLEEENKVLRESCGKGDNPADDDMIRLQLETLLAEKARLAHENSVYARENRFLREIVEYHQLTMQDIVYLDEGIEEVTEVYPIPAVSRMLSTSPPAPASPCTPSEVPLSRSSSVTALASIAPQVAADHEAPPTSTGEDLRSQ